MNLKSLSTKKKSEEGSIMQVVDPQTKAPVVDEDGNPTTITLAGQDSPIYRRTQQRQADKILQGRKPTIKAAQNYENTLETLAKCTLAWSGIDDSDGKPLPCTEQNAMDLYRELDWLAEDVEAFIFERSNYLGNA